MAIISSKNVYKFDKDTSLYYGLLLLVMILMEITMTMAIHETFGSIV